jgi:uncharacterized Zn finger protein
VKRPHEVSETVAERAQDLIEERRVTILSPTTALVAGGAGLYRVQATVTGIRCTCPSRVRCCHAAAAMAAWAERGGQ